MRQHYSGKPDLAEWVIWWYDGFLWLHPDLLTDLQIDRKE
jgi:hypothetical protein